MSGKNALFLLAGLFLILAPGTSLSQETRSPVPLRSLRIQDISGIPGHTPPVRDPGRAIRPYPTESPDSSTFAHVVKAAGMIFSGTVTRIRRSPATNGQSIETIAITFHVENAIRATAAGKDLTISEWGGLWSTGPRYRLGERLLVCLYAHSKLGLTSSVGDPLGKPR